MGMKRKVLSLLLCLVMCLSLVPAAFATDTDAAGYSETVSGTVGVPMDEIVYYVGDDGTYPGKAELVSGNMPAGLEYEVDTRGYVHIYGTPE